MTRALELAARATGQTSPNPLVGAVVVAADGQVVGEGFHARAGAAHAEVEALRQAGERARGATLYVTLEPCNHHGRTPPCAPAVVAAGIARVVVAAPDPNPQVSGGGIEWLRQHGLAVEVGCLEVQARLQNRFFLTWAEMGRPFVTLKYAMSLDGKIACDNGHSKWITGAEARSRAHQERSRHDAILVGIGTVLADDPLLTARFGGGRCPQRIILDSTARTPLSARLLSAGPAPLVVVTAAAPPERCRDLREAGAEVVSLATGADGRVDIPSLLQCLAGRHVQSLLVEGGSTVLRAFLENRIADRLLAFVAPLVVGGARPAVAAGVFSAPSVVVGEADLSMLDRDILLEGTPRWN